MKKNKHAQAMANARWAKTTPEERKVFASKAGKVSAMRRKKYGWAYWKKKDTEKKLQQLLKCILFIVVPGILGLSIGLTANIFRTPPMEMSSGVVSKNSLTTAKYSPPTNFCELNFIECD